MILFCGTAGVTNHFSFAVSLNAVIPAELMNNFKPFLISQSSNFEEKAV